MARFFLSLLAALATAAAILGASSSASAQPALSSSSSAPAAAPKPDFPEVQKALDLLTQQRDLAGCKRMLHDAALKYSKLPNEDVMLYQLFAQMNQANAARQALYDGIYEHPSDPEPWVILANIALNENRLPEAEIDFAKANQLLEKYDNKDRKPIIQQQALSGMAAVAERRGQWQQAETRLDEILKASPKDIVALQRRARAKFWQKNVNEANDDLKTAKKIDLENVANDPTHKTREQMLPARAILAQYYDAYESQDRPKKVKSKNAEDSYKVALQQAPNDLNLRAVVAVWALENGDVELAKEQAKEALRIEEEDRKLPPSSQKWPGSTAGRMLSGYVAIWAKDFPKAEEYFQQVFLETPNDFAVKNNMALALIEQNDPRKQNRALDYALGNYQANKDNIEAASTLSWVYFKLDKFDLASTVMDAVLRATNGNITNPDTAFYLTKILCQNDNGKNGFKAKAKDILKTFLDSGRSFSMKPEAIKLYESVKDATEPTTSTTPTPKM
jgi:tetratricopeptide (TPR) repeat protein